jgi:hypothetical protein
MSGDRITRGSPGHHLYVSNLPYEAGDSSIAAAFASEGVPVVSRVGVGEQPAGRSGLWRASGAAATP